MEGFILENAVIVNEGLSFKGGIFVKDGLICDIFDYDKLDDRLRESALLEEGCEAVDLHWHYLAPGVIDTHVHFREPGLTHKADIYTESRAAVAGGVTSFMDMPNTNPQTTTQALLQQKFDLAAEKSLANYSFYLGATNDNLAEVVKTDPKKVCGIKLFMGSSTGNMLVAVDYYIVFDCRGSGHALRLAYPGKAQRLVGYNGGIL